MEETQSDSLNIIQVNKLERAAAMSVNEIVVLLDQQEHLLTQQEQLLASRLKLEEDLAKAQAQLDWYKRQVFGARSERRTLASLTPSEQLFLGEQMLDTPEAPPEATTTVAEHERKKRKNPTKLQETDSRLRFDDTVPVETIEVVNPEVAGIPTDLLVKVGQKETYRLAQRPASYVVLKYVQTTYRVKETDQVLSVPVPTAIFNRSYADVSLLAGMVVDKFQFHLPLYRQHQRMQAGGLDVTRATLTRLVRRVGELLEPIYNALLSSILLSQVLAADESPTPAGKGNGKIKKGFFWAFFGDKTEVAFLFSPSRSRKVLDEFLKGFQGTLLTDGYIAYESFAKSTAGVTAAQCWAHTRRYFIEGEKAAPPQTNLVLSWMRQLYEIEDRGRDCPDKLLELRMTESRTIVDRLFEFFRKELQSTALLPSNAFLQAVEYASARERELRVFLSNPAVQIDTNHIERTLRGQAVGRKNWMFHVTEVGARHAGIFYSLIQSCLLAGVRPYEYLVDVLQRIQTHPASEVHMLTPREWPKHFAKDPMRSDLDRHIGTIVAARPAPA